MSWRPRRRIPVAQWPEADRRLWRAALVPGDLLDDGGARSHYSRASNWKTEVGYGYWLAWLSRRGLLDAPVSPDERITPDRVKAFVTDMLTISATGTVLSHLQELSDAARVMNPTRDWRWIRGIEARVRAIHEPARSKRDRLVGAADLLALGQKLMQTAPALSTDRLRAMQFRDGLIIALLAARPLRLRNLVGFVLDRTVVRRAGCWWITIPAEETKTREPIEVPWPELLSAALDVYLHQHRPVLCRLRSRRARDVGRALWVSGGAPLRRSGIYNIIVRRTAEAFGKPINPHLFRDCAATSIAIEDPTHVRIASQILGHRSTATTERYYNQAQAIDAARRYQDFLVALRSGTVAEDIDSV